MLKDCPGSIDVLDLQFKLQCRLKVFENKDISNFAQPSSLLSCASRYGLVFAGSSSNYFVAIQTNILHSYDTSEKDVPDFPRRTIPLFSPPKHISVNCDSSIIAVIVEEEQCPVAIFYDVLSFLGQNIKIIRKIRLSPTPGVYVQEINWNPSLPGIFTACKSDGTLGVYELKGDSVDINELPAAAGATCFCWSPKGKQIAVGSKDGKITQYKPDLKAVKVINAPELEGSHRIISLQWVSNYQFIGAFQSVEKNDSFIIVVDAPKTGEVCYTNFYDICYSGTTRQPQFYLLLQQTWNFLMVASANSTEVGVLGCSNDLWTQWIMSDTARAELPLSTDHQETFPVGVAFDISSTTPLPWGEGTVPPCPTLCILSHQGVLCCFNVVYLKEGVPSVCTPADNVSDTTGLAHFVSEGFQTGHTGAVQGLENTPPKEKMLPLSGVSLSTNIPIQSTPVLNSKGANTTVAKTLFGGVQATITPIKPQESVQGASLYGGQTLITPIAKDSINTEDKKDNLNEKYSSIFSSLTPSSVPPNVKVPVKPIVVSAVASEATKTPEPSSAMPQLKDTKKSGQFVKQESQVDKAEMKAILLQMIRDEWMSLEAELRVQLKMGASLKVNIGSEDEKLRMVENIRLLEEFINEAVEISVSQGAEIHCLKQNIIQAWAWFEEAKSHYNVTKDEALALLLKLQPLDSLSKKKREAIEQLDYYIETQMAQANKALDEQWNKFQDYTRKNHKVEMPTLEAIFQTIVHQNAILQKQTHLLKDISFRLKRKTPNISAVLSAMDKSLDLVSNLENLSLDPDAILQLQYEKVKKYAQNVSVAKSKKLHTLIKTKPVRKVLAIKPKMSSWSINFSPSSKTRESLSKLDALSASVRAVQLDLQNTEDIDNKPETPSPLFKNGTAFNTSLGSSAFTPIVAVSTSNSQAQIPKLTNSSYINVSQSSTPGFNSTAPSFKTDLFKPTTNLQGGLYSNTTNQQQQLPFGSSIKPISESPSVSAVLSGANKVPTTVVASAFATATTQPAFSSFNMTPETKSFFGNKAPSGLQNLSSKDGETKLATTEVKGSTSFTDNSRSKSEESNVITLSLFSAKPTSGSSSSTTTTTTTSSSGFFSTLAKSGSTPAASASNNFNMSNLFSSVNTASALSAGLLEGSVAPASAVESSFNALGMASNTAFEAKTVPNSNVPATISASISNILSNTNSPSTPLNLSGLPGSKQDNSASPLSTATMNAPFGLKSVVTSTSDIQNNSSVSPIKHTTTTTSNKPSIFGSPASFQLTSSTAPSKSEEATPTSCSTGALFGTPISSTAAGPSAAKGESNLFATTATTKESSSSFTSAGFFNPATSISISSASGQGLFGSPAVSTSTTGSIFANGSNNNATAKATSQSIFGGSATSISSSNGPFLGGVSATSSAQNVASGFASSTSTVTTAFGGFPANASTTTSSTFAGFGSTATTTSSFGSLTPTNLFGASSSSGGLPIPNTKPTMFGSPTVTTTTTTGSIFSASSPSSNKGNIFGGTLSSGASAFGTGSVFGAPASTTTTASSGFGSSTTTPAFGQSGSIFGAAPNTNVNNTFAQSSSIFGGTQSTTASSIFGKPAVTSTGTSSIFGQTAVSSSPSSIFGQPATTAATSSIFGQPATSSTGTSSVFGQSATSSGSSIFGPPATTSSGSLFGSNSSTTLFASGNSFGQSATANPFGKTDAPTFGASSNIFGSAPATSATTNVFGGAPTSTASSIFGGNTASTFGSATTSSGFGSPNTFGSASTFGQKPAFGQAPAFGSSTFGSPQQPGPFSGGGSGTGAAFGASPAFQKPSGFGSAPVFGGSPTVSPAFGSAATFGGTPTFGSAATFGSPDKVFGANQPTGGFGAAPQSPSAGFGNLAAQNTIGFGNLAQQAATPSTNVPFSGGSSFSSWR